MNITSVETAAITGVFAVLAVLIPIILNKYMGDKQAAATLGDAIVNALGAIEQAAVGAMVVKPTSTIPGVPDKLQVGVRYVLDHAGKAVERFKLSPEMIADKINAQIGLQAVRNKHLDAKIYTPLPATAQDNTPKPTDSPASAR